ncbi:MAG: amidohydrolase [Hyphomicrobiaceae bacterium]
MAGSNAQNCNPYKESAGRVHVKGGYDRPETLVVDLHGHMLVAKADDFIRPHLPADKLDAVKFAPPLTRELNVKQNKDRWEELTGLEQRIKDMDRMGIDVMVMSPAPPQFNYMAEAALGHEANQIVNDGLAAGVKQMPDRLVAIGTVPLQDTDLAVSELVRCMTELGMYGVELGANVAGEELSSERLDPFWAKAQELGATILIHPTAFASNRFGNHYFTNIIGNPLDTTVAIHYLIFDGVMERFPDLKIVLSHGGAFASHYAARMDHAWGARPDCCQHITQPPTSYLKKFYFDNIVFEVDQLEFLGKKFGAEHIVLGTDYPFDMGEYDPIEHISQASFSQADREKICGLNAVRLLGLDIEKFSRADFKGGAYES